MQNLKIKTTDNREVEIKAEVTVTSIKFSYRINDQTKWVSKMTPALVTEKFIKFAEITDGQWQVASSMMTNTNAAISSFLQPTFEHFKSEILAFEMPELHELHRVLLPSLYTPSAENMVAS